MLLGTHPFYNFQWHTPVRYNCLILGSMLYLHRIGILLGFISNAQLSSSLNNFVGSANASLAIGLNYATNTLDVNYEIP